MADLTSTPYDTPFRASALKLARARQHVAEFRNVIAEYAAAGIATPLMDTDEQGHVTFKGWDFKGVPDVLSPTMGDIVHNLRSALDLMACELARRNRKSDKNVFFPFAESEEKLDEQIASKNFDRAGPAAVQLLREYRPYKGGNIELRALHDLDVQDKHKALILAPGVLAGLKVSWEPQKEGRPKPTPETNFELFMSKDSALSGRNAISALEQLVELTGSIVGAFERLSVPAGKPPVRWQGVWNVALSVRR